MKFLLLIYFVVLWVENGLGYSDDRFVDYFDCYNCTYFPRGENKLCDNPTGDKMGMLAVGYVSHCRNTRRRGPDNWGEVSRCVVITGKGWKQRKCMGANEFLKTFYHSDWKRVMDSNDFSGMCGWYAHQNDDTKYLQCKEKEKRKQDLRNKNQLFSVFQIHMDEMDECKTFDKIQYCGCTGDLCNFVMRNVPSLFQILFSVLLLNAL